MNAKKAKKLRQEIRKNPALAQLTNKDDRLVRRAITTSNNAHKAVAKAQVDQFEAQQQEKKVAEEWNKKYKLSTVKVGQTEVQVVEAIDGSKIDPTIGVDK